jgi:hypothetical protein
MAFIQRNKLGLLTLYFFCSNNTPLHCAVAGGHLEVCSLLLQYNADPQAKGYK